VITLRDVEASDLPFFFEHQREPAANAMAAFPARDEPTFYAHWRDNVLGHGDVVKRTVLCDGEVAGNVVSYVEADSGRRLVGYWIGERFWGRGVATAALRLFVADVSPRPLSAFVARSNPGSIRVLEKAGFVRTGEHRGRHGEVQLDVFVYELA